MQNRLPDPPDAPDATDATYTTHVPHPSSLAPDADLVRAARAGQAAAFEALTRRHFPMVFAIAYARLADREAAEDLAQEAFLRAFLHLHALTDPARFAAWLARIARNEAGMWLRQSRSASRLVCLVPLDDLLAEPADPAARQARADLEADEETRALRQALFELPADQRELVMLHYFEGLNNAEIAERLDVHRATVGRQIEKALKTMKRSLEPILRRAAPAFRHSGAAAARTLAVVGALTALSAPAKAALLAEAGASAALAAAWHTILSGGILMSAKTQLAAVVVLLALLAGGAYYQVSRTMVAPKEILAANAGTRPTDPAAPTSATAALPPDFARFAAANEANRKQIRTVKVTLLYKSSRYPNPNEAWRNAELKRITEESEARLKQRLETNRIPEQAAEIRKWEEKMLASDKEEITEALEYETREVRYYDYENQKCRVESEPAGDRTEPAEPPQRGFSNYEVRFVVLYESAGLLDGLFATYQPLMKSISMGPEPASHGAPQPFPCSGTVDPRDLRSLVPIGSHAATADGHADVAYEFGRAHADPESKWRDVVYADPEMGFRYRRMEHRQGGDDGLMTVYLASEYQVVNGVPIPFYCEKTFYWPDGKAPWHREVYRVLAAEINVALPDITFQFDVPPGTQVHDYGTVLPFDLPENHGPLTPHEIRALALAEKERKAEQDKKAREQGTVAQPAPVGIPAPPAH